jgi:parvulin-like peptidyl-prolyl isomerase
LRTQIEKKKLIKRHYKEKREAVEKEAAQLVNDEFTTDYYENNKDKFVIPGRVRLREILLKADSGGGPAHWEKVSSDAMKIISRIHSGENFAELAKELSEDEYAEKGGDMGLAHVGSFIPEIERAIRGLGVGEIAGPVMTLYGYHILKLEERAPSVQKSYYEVKVRLKDDLAEKEQKRLWTEWVDNLRESATIDYAPDIKELSAE